MNPTIEHEPWERWNLTPYVPDPRSIHEMVADLILHLPISGVQRNLTIPQTARCERHLTRTTYSVPMGHDVTVPDNRCPNQATTSALGNHVCPRCATDVLR